MFESDIESYRNYFYIEAEKNILEKVSLKARFRGVPMRAKMPDFDWTYDEEIAQSDLNRIEYEKTRMAKKFADQKEWDKAEKNSKMQATMTQAKQKADLLAKKAKEAAAKKADLEKKKKVADAAKKKLAIKAKKLMKK